VATTRGNVGETRGTPSTGKLANAHAQWQFCASRACAMSVQAAGNFLAPVLGNICLTMAEMRRLATNRWQQNIARAILFGDLVLVAN
jgi:hypothetical protein